MDDTLAHAPKTKRKFRGIKAESYLKDKFLHGKPNRRSWVLGCTACTACRGENCTRFLKLMRFFLVCSASLIQLVAPWMLCTLEIVAVLCIYCLGTSRSLVLHPVTQTHHYHFSYQHSLEDIVVISIARTMLLSVTYAVGMRYMHRPYLYTSYLLAALCFPAIVVKTILFRYSQDGVSAACIFGFTGLFCWLHVFAARRSVEWVRRRAQLGLTGYGCPWDEAPEDGWTPLRRAPDIEEMTKSSDGPEWGEDVAPETLADSDSKFVDVGGVRVHYKEALPPTTHHQSVSRGSNGSIGSCSSGSSCAERSSSGIVLIHGFGGGVVSWRHLLEPLARHTGLRVVAYDRPAFGLTSRPVPASDQGNPYTMESQAALVLDLCCQLGLQEVILAGHADGCLLAMKANSLLASERAAGSLSSSSSTAAFTTRHSDTPTPIFRPPSPTLSRDSAQAAAAAAAAAWPPTGSPSASPTPPFTACQGAGGAAAAPGASDGGPTAVSGRRGRRQSASRERQTSSSDHSRTVSSEGEQQLYDAASQFGSMGSSAGSLCQPFMSTCSSCSLGVQSAYHTPFSTSTAANTPSHGTLAAPPAAGLTSEGTHTAVCASAAADGCDSAVGVGGGAAGSGSNGNGGTVMLRGSSTRHRKPQVAAGSSGQTPPQSPSLHAWSPNERPCRPLRVIGLAFLHPDLSGSLGPSMTRLLARSKLGRSILRPLLRSEIGEVANPRAWYNPEKLTPEVVELYKAPVEGWCEALIETTRLRSSSQKCNLSTCVSDARPLPALILTGLHDVIVLPMRADQLAQSLPLSRVAVLAECGHLSHEEVPMALLQQLVMFCSQVCV